MIVNKAHILSLISIIFIINLANGDLKNSDKDASLLLRKIRDNNSKYYQEDRSLKPEENTEDDRDIKTSTALGKRCTTCDNGYLRPSYERGREKYYDRDPYYFDSSNSRSRYDPYYDRYDDYDSGRGRTRYYDRYEPRDRYYDRGYENRGYDYYNPYNSNRDRWYDAYNPYDDYYSRGYESGSTRGGYGGRPSEFSSGGNGYARGYSYGGDRDRYGGYGGYGGYGSYSNSYGSGSRSRYPAYDYDSGYRSTSYLYGRPSSTTTDNPSKNSGSDQSNTAAPVQGGSSGRSK